jgi:hypothetical protein
LTGKGGYAMGILDKFSREGASGVVYRMYVLQVPPLTFEDFGLIFTGFTPEIPRRGSPFWKMHGGSTPPAGWIASLSRE